jgi:hypothetical protein
MIQIPPALAKVGQDLRQCIPLVFGEVPVFPQETGIRQLLDDDGLRQ